MKEIKIIKKNLPLLLVLLCLGIIFLVFSEYDLSKGSGSPGITEEDKAYIESLETRLSQMIEEIDGAGKTKVMITLEGSSRQQYATQRVIENDGNKSSVSTFLIQKDSGGNMAPILIGTDAPKILGVSVVAKGADDILIRQKILGLVAGTLNLNQNKIFVTS